MKNYLIIFAFLLIANCSFAQFPTPYFNQGSAGTAVDNKGGLFVRKTLAGPTFTDTAAANATCCTNLYPFSQILTTSDNLFWIRSADITHWINLGAGQANFHDTVKVQFPMGVFWDSTNHQVIYIRAANGLVSGGTVSLDTCMRIQVTPAIYNLNFTQYTSLATSLTISTAHATLGRIDLVVVDTFGVASVLTGTPSATPIAPQPDPSYQLSLSQISVAAAATCLAITARIVYDQNLGVTSEFDATSSGTISVAYGNTDNPYHLTKAAFVPTYSTGSQLIFTHTGAQDTVTSGELLKFFLYLNTSIFNSGNQIQTQFFLGTTVVSANTVINSFFNTLDTAEYQNVSIPMTAFNFSSSYFNKIVFTLAGDDNSGSGGFYLDYIQLQKGITNTAVGLTLTTNTSTSASTLINNVLNIPPAWSIIGNAETASSNFLGTTDGVPLRFKVNSIANGIIDLPAIANTAIGYASLSGITSGTFNTAFGYNTLPLNTSGISNVAIGASALAANTTGSNTAVGTSALRANTSGDGNAAFGNSALRFNTTGTINTAIGTTAMNANTTGHRNVAVGVDALRSNTTGAYNTILGEDSWRQNSGNYNSTLGNRAGYQATGDSNVLIGFSAGYNSTGNNKLYIANTNTATPLIYGEFDTPALTLGGALKLRNYGGGTHTGTAAYTLKVDASGNVIEGGANQRFGIEDNTSTQNRSMDMQTHTLNIDKANYINLEARDTTLSSASLIAIVNNPVDNYLNLYSTDGGSNFTSLVVTPTAANIQNANHSELNIVTSINGSNFADNNGNVTVATPSLAQVSAVDYITTTDLVTYGGGRLIASANAAHTTGGKTIINSGYIEIYNTSNFAAALNVNNVTANRSLEMPNNGGTLALSVNGSLANTAGDILPAYVAKTGTYTATASDYTINCTANTFTVTLPTAIGITGRIYKIVNSGSGTITIGTTSSQTFTNINATPTTLSLAAVGAGAITQYEVQSNGANWLVTGKVKNE